MQGIWEGKRGAKSFYVFLSILFWLSGVGFLVSGLLALDEVTFQMVVFVGAVAIVLFLFEVIWKFHLPFCILLFSSFLAAPLYGIRFPLWGIGLLILYLVGFQTLRVKGREEKNYVPAVKGTVTICLLAVVCFCTAAALVTANEAWFYDSTYKVEGFFYRISKQFLGTANDPSSSGKISKGNNYVTGAAVFEVESDKEPGETMYLRGFSGQDYVGGEWVEADDSAILETVTRKLGWQNWQSMIEVIYNSMYFVSNGSMTEEKERHILHITHSSGDYESFYEPYFGLWNRALTMESDEGYFYQYYEQNEMGIDWEKILPNYVGQTEWYRSVQEAYLEEAKKIYTRVPKDGLPRLIALCQEEQPKGQEEVTAFIRSVLRSCTYTRTPGLTAYDGDIVEDFLFERHRGYCVHFASAAVLMYRFYGIPARYVSGYAVPASEFEALNDGKYRAFVTDEMSHAWVEIFVEDYGWTPVELTPSAGGAQAEAWDFTGQEISFPQIPDFGGSWQADTQGNTIAVEETEREFVFPEKTGSRGIRCLYILFGFFGVLCIVLLFFVYRRKWKLGVAETMGCRKIFSRFIRMLHFGGYMNGYHGEEDDFSEKLCEEVREIPEWNVRRMLEVVRESAYGPGTVGQKEEELVWNVYMQYGKVVYEKASWVKKMIFRYWKAFG